MSLAATIGKLPAWKLAQIVAAGSLLTILGALGFQYIGGLPPCPLCLTQRIAYYAAILGGLLALLVLRAGRRRLAGLILAVIGFGLIYNVGLGVYHSGIEWKWWPGPLTCTGTQAVSTDAGSLLDKLNKMHVVRCDEAAFRFLWLSMAGWSALISLSLGLASLRAAVLAAR